MSDTSAADSLRVVETATCTACGCLCDDIAVSVRDDRIVAAGNACPVGERWFLADRLRSGIDSCSVEGTAATPDEALERASRLLREARSPLILGLASCPTETTTAALALADQVRGLVDSDPTGTSAARLTAFQRVGRVSATLGEAKNRADVVLFWGGDPVTSHPRHFERYSVEPRGRFVPEGREGRTVIVLDAERTPTAECADLFLPVPAERRFETLWTLRALLRGVPLDARRVGQATGLELKALATLAERLKQARYGALFYGSLLGDSGEIEAILTLVRDLNAHTRFVTLGLGSPGNASGVEAATTWQTGFSGRVDFRLGFPCSWPGETGAEAMLASGEADLALIIGEDVSSTLTDRAQEQLSRLPRIVIGPRATDPALRATVGLATATSGIDAGGTVTRLDSVTLSLRPALSALLPADREWLQALLKRLTEEGKP